LDDIDTLRYISTSLPNATGAYRTDFGFSSAKRAESKPEHAQVYEKTYVAFAGLKDVSGDPKAAGRAILSIVDAENPP
jgi:hypothetical protein